jgi:hypothetical protein
MSRDKRPGGLTALAVLNFVFGGLGVLGLLALWALISMASAITAGEATASSGAGALYGLLALSTVSVALLITSAVGYLGQKKFLGRSLGTAYAVVAVLGSVVGLATGQPFGISTVIGLVYPVLTLILLNTTFKDDLVN